MATPRHIAWKPRLRGEYSYATGNAHRNAQRASTFDQLYPSNHNAFGLTDLFGFQNIREARVNLYLNPLKNLTVLVQQEWLSMATKQDDVYAGSASVLAKPPTAGFSRSGLGREIDASGAYVFHDYLVVNAGVGHFSPDGAMVQSGHGAPLTIAYLSFNYRFKLDRKLATPQQRRKRPR
ncbi:alginate export family protein [Granulicella sibirica]|uniref:alginate export family protein n=1 Tax=Granulicella sibirica TaxID=2479048 RepID=UPI0013759C1C|nr:alginate export family protein [Granulicella sibirica]